MIHIFSFVIRSMSNSKQIKVLFISYLIYSIDRLPIRFEVTLAICCIHEISCQMSQTICLMLVKRYEHPHVLYFLKRLFSEFVIALLLSIKIYLVIQIDSIFLCLFAVNFINQLFSLCIVSESIVTTQLINLQYKILTIGLIIF